MGICYCKCNHMQVDWSQEIPKDHDRWTMMYAHPRAVILRMWRRVFNFVILVRLRCVHKKKKKTILRISNLIFVAEIVSKISIKSYNIYLFRSLVELSSVLLLLCSCSFGVIAYNLDLESPTIVNSGLNDTENYDFGFSLAQHEFSNGEKMWDKVL